MTGFDVDYLIAYNKSIEQPVIIQTTEPFHAARVFCFTTHKDYMGYFESNSFLISRTIDGYKIIIAYDGTLSGRVIDITFDYKDELGNVLKGMESFFREERINRFPKTYEKYIF